MFPGKVDLRVDLRDGVIASAHFIFHKSFFSFISFA